MKIQEMTSAVTKLYDPQFQRAYCARPGLRYNALKPYCKKLEFVTDGFSTEINHLAEQIAESMHDYNPQTDCLILTGTGIVNILIGYYLSNRFPKESIAVAFFQKEVTKYDQVVSEEDYQFYRFYPRDILRLG
jgi:predicted secreted protein